jgi:AcrR family transcriptional regulator/DNA-binding MarR family transcriptional regulator
MASQQLPARLGRDNGARAAQLHDGFQRERLGDLQRARILSATFDVACERGAHNMSVSQVVERSGVSRRTFYETFTDREDCFLAAFEQALAYASERVLGAYESQKTWSERVRAGLVALLSFLEEEPVIGRLLIVESLLGGASTIERRAQVVSLITRAIDEGREQAKATSPPAPLAAEAVAGGVLSVIHARLVAGERDSLAALAGPLMSMIVLPYLGAAAARRELDRPLPPSPRREGREGSALLEDPFKDAGMRLTYRTVRVLMAILDHPGGSNRLIGESADMTDQGQISKLLSRLERVALVENTGLGPSTGAPNAWTLTAKGRRVTDSIHAHTRHGEGHAMSHRAHPFYPRLRRTGGEPR